MGPRTPVVLEPKTASPSIELLVVCLVIGILCAIAIPAFTSQKSKAHDAQAKEMVRSAMTAAESIATEHDGFYDEVECRDAARSRDLGEHRPE